MEKNQGGTGPDVVARIVAAAKQLKAVTDAPVLMYTNLLLDWPQFATLHEEFAANAADWRLEDARGAVVNFTKSGPVWKSNLQPDFNVRACDRFDATLSAVLRELDESNRFVQKSAESTSI